jgi:hypothetical protein
MKIISKSWVFVIITTILTGFLILGSVSCCGLFGVEEENNSRIENSRSEETRTYKDREIEYFFETVFGAEYGDSDYAVHKWADDIRIDIKGHPTKVDLETLDEVIFELNYLIDDITLSIVNWDGDIQMYFDAPSNFSSIEPNYIPGNSGFFWAWWDGSGNLYKARVLIATEGVTQDERSHLIWEELTQVLGIMNDSYEYADSIFYQEWTDVQGLSDIDKAVVEILYDPRLESGMDMEEVVDILYNKR